MTEVKKISRRDFSLDRFVIQKGPEIDKEVLDRLIREFVATDERPAALVEVVKRFFFKHARNSKNSRNSPFRHQLSRGSKYGALAKIRLENTTNGANDYSGSRLVGYDLSKASGRL